MAAVGCRPASPRECPHVLTQATILWGRSRLTADDDVRGVLRERVRSLDIRVIRSTLATLEEALSRSDLLPSFEAELARAENRRPT